MIIAALIIATISLALSIASLMCFAYLLIKKQVVQLPIPQMQAFDLGQVQDDLNKQTKASRFLADIEEPMTDDELEYFEKINKR